MSASCSNSFGVVFSEKLSTSLFRYQLIKMQNISKLAFSKIQENSIYLLTVACLSVEACVTSAFEIVRKLGTFAKVLAWIWCATTLD